MKVISEIKDLRNALKPLQGKKIALVPTMGFLHAGHLSLVRRARAECDSVVVSIFVNPTQFAPGEDLKKYPRDLKQDQALLAREKVDFLFCPTESEMYQAPDTWVEVNNLSNKLCGLRRPGHFRGVTTVVSKLFNIVSPTDAYFGQKDYQQFLVIKKLVKDLNFNIRINSLPIVRERSGLALSSRNAYLSDRERKEASIIFKSLQMGQKEIQKGEKNSAYLRKKIIKNITENSRGEIDYLEILKSDTLENVDLIQGPVGIFAAVFFGQTRLIDNVLNPNFSK